MHVGLIAPPWVPVPPPAYGGTEEVVDELARGLASAGHRVTLFATGDSSCPVARRWAFDTAVQQMNTTMPECRHVQAAYDELRHCDVIHDHTTVGPVWARSQGITTPIVVTVHNPFTADSRPVYRRISEYASIVAISRSHRAQARDVPVRAVIRHGLDPTRFVPGDGSGGYAMYLGRFAPEKGAAEAIRIARGAGWPLVIAAKMQTPEERLYYVTLIEPELGPDVHFVGEATRAERDRLLRNATALLDPITWSEPFGLVMIEALASGTPVVAFPNGAAPEIIDDGVTGFLPRTEAEASAALRATPTLDRGQCRAAVEGYYSARRMVDDYVDLYSRLTHGPSVLRAG